ncbi:MAG: DUF2442 domain-containing protein [Deltaproteobacteria bacterium]|nr:DUF2442 domain-containing protein [Deltaproteobacteria bacterium]
MQDLPPLTMDDAAPPDRLPADGVRLVSVLVPEFGTVELTFADGMAGTLDMRPLVARGGVFAHLTSPEMFARARVGENGWSLEWPAPDGTWDETAVVDLCADSLWLQVKGLWKRP